MLNRLAPLEEVIDRQQDDGADQRHDETCCLALLVVSNKSPEKRSEKGSCNSDDHGYQNPAGILSGHDELGERTDDKTDDGGPKQAKHKLLQCFESHGLGPLNSRGADSILHIHRYKNSQNRRDVHIILIPTAQAFTLAGCFRPLRIS